MPTTLLTGLPRSGTTLVCVLLNAQPDVVALAEPMDPPDHHDRERALAEIANFVSETRERAQTGGLVRSKSIGGALVDNFMTPPQAGGGLRRSVAESALIPVGKPLAADFHLFVKHPALFSALAEPLARRFPLFALVRDPLSVLASWQTISFPVHHGHMPVAERFVPELSERLARAPGRVERQVELLSWLLSVYAGLGAERVVRYEDLLADPPTALARLGVAAGRVDHPLRSVPVEQRYPGVDLVPLATALRRISPQVQAFYPDFERTLAHYAR